MSASSGLTPGSECSVAEEVDQGVAEVLGLLDVRQVRGVEDQQVGARDALDHRLGKFHRRGDVLRARDHQGSFLLSIKS